MSILFVLLTFLLILTVMYFRKPQPGAEALQLASSEAAPVPLMKLLDGYEIPSTYKFHPGHTWLSDEGRQNGRIGMDSFAANLIGQIDSVEFPELNRWVRQGQRFCTVNHGDRKVDLLSPVEGVLVSINHEVVKNANLAVEDPYKDGWLCVIKAPELSINSKNLLQASMGPSWMQHSAARLSEVLQGAAPAMAQDGGLPVKGLLFQVDAEVQQKLRKEFFLT